MINYITAPFKWFFKLEAASGLVLLLAAIVALVLSNTNFSALYFKILKEFLEPVSMLNQINLIQIYRSDEY